jgi:hypothetical protein
MAEKVGIRHTFGDLTLIGENRCAGTLTVVTRRHCAVFRPLPVRDKNFTIFSYQLPSKTT